MKPMTDIAIGNATAVLVAVEAYPTHMARQYELGTVHIQVNLGDGSDDAARISRFLAMAEAANGSKLPVPEARP